MRSVDFRTSAATIEGLLALIQAASPIVDLTYGNGTFWTDSPRQVIGCDQLPERAKTIVADFYATPFRTDSIATVIFDPPFHPTGANSREELRFRAMGENEKDLKVQFQRGVREAWRITARHLIVKCQGFVHNHRPQWMPLWAIDVCGEPFEWAVSARTHKVVSGRWKTCRSLRRNHADYLVFDKLGNHR